MAVEDFRLRVRRDLEGIGLSMESASYLLDDRPPGGWGDVVTNTTLDLRLEALEQRLRAEIAGVRSEIAGVRTEMADQRAGLRDEMREQTWRLTGALLASMGLVAAILRFTG
jgi:hypothetical protein